MGRTIHLCTVVGGYDILLLNRLITHYRFLGVNGRFMVAVHVTGPGDSAFDRVHDTLSPLGIEIAMTVVGPWRHRLNPGAYWEMRSLYPNDWTILADQDEFQVYPDDLQAVVDFCERRGYDSVTGAFLDRVSADGTLAEIVDGRSLWSTFPLGCQLTRTVIDDPGRKVVLAKGCALVGWGNHALHRGVACPPGHFGVPVHHFKWDAGVLERLERRYALYRGLGEPYAEESAEFIRYIREHGRIPVEDTQLRVRRVGNPYGMENLLD